MMHFLLFRILPTFRVNGISIQTIVIRRDYELCELIFLDEFGNINVSLPILCRDGFIPLLLSLFSRPVLHH